MAAQSLAVQNEKRNCGSECNWHGQLVSEGRLKVFPTVVVS